jgi:hypothetical protein
MMKIYHERFFFFPQPARQSGEFDNSQRDGHPIYILLDGSLHQCWVWLIGLCAILARILTLVSKTLPGWYDLRQHPAPGQHSFVVLSHPLSIPLAGQNFMKIRYETQNPRMCKKKILKLAEKNHFGAPKTSPPLTQLQSSTTSPRFMSNWVHVKFNY